MKKLVLIALWIVVVIVFVLYAWPIFPWFRTEGPSVPWRLAIVLLAAVAGTLRILWGKPWTLPRAPAQDSERARRSLQWVILLVPLGIALPLLLRLTEGWVIPAFPYPLRPFLTVVAFGAWFTALIWNARVFGDTFAESDASPMPPALRSVAAIGIFVGVFAIYWLIWLWGAKSLNEMVAEIYLGLLPGLLVLAVAVTLQRVFLKRTRAEERWT